MKKRTLKELRGILRKEGIRGFSKMDRPQLEKSVALIEKSKEERTLSFGVGDHIYVKHMGIWERAMVLETKKIDSPTVATVMLTSIRGGRKYSPSWNQWYKKEIMNQGEFTNHLNSHIMNGDIIYFRDNKGDINIFEGEEYYFKHYYFNTIEKGKFCGMAYKTSGENFIVEDSHGNRWYAEAIYTRKEVEKISYDTSRCYGFELEVSNKMSTSKGRNILPIDLIKKDYKVVFDGSIGGGFELVSPILKEDNFNDIEMVTDTLINMGSTVRKTCGLHVHQDATGITPMIALKLINIYRSYYELALKSFIASDRFNNTYCNGYDSPIGVEGIKELCHMCTSWRKEESEEFMSATDAFFSRYMCVNLVSLGEHGTVEFRQMHSTLNPNEIKAWIKVTRAMMDLAFSDKPFGYSNRSFKTMCADLNLDKETITTLKIMQYNKLTKGA